MPHAFAAFCAGRAATILPGVVIYLSRTDTQPERTSQRLCGPSAVPQACAATLSRLLELELLYGQGHIDRMLVRIDLRLREDFDLLAALCEERLHARDVLDERGA